MTSASTTAATPAIVPRATAIPYVQVLQVVFVVSGFCGLIYESIWSHYLKLFVGHAAYAQSVVLVVFIGGMALGAWGAGRYAERIRNPLWAYAAVELVVGVISLLFHQLFVGVTDWAYVSLLPAVCSPESPCLAQWLLAALLIMPQSILLGMTFPFMTTAILRIARSRPGSRIALLYFLNSFGAVIGVLASGFVLIPALGLPGTLLTAGLFNIALGIVAYAIGKTAGQRVVPAERTGDRAEESRATLVPMLLIAALTGMSSFIYEIVWIRMLVLVVGASTQAFELMLAAFILGLALGGLWVRNHVDRFRDLIGALAIVQVLMGLAALATLPVYDRTFDFLAWLIGSLKRSDGGYLLYNFASHGVAIAVMLPATFLAGMTLPLITTALLRTRLGERAVGYVYAANTLGAIVGVIIAVHFALPVLGLKSGLLLGALVDIVLGVVLMLSGRTLLSRRAVVCWCAAGLAGLVAAHVLATVSVERMAAGVFRYGLARIVEKTEFLFHEDGKTATVTVSQTPRLISIKTNGKPDASISTDRSKPELDEYTMALTGVLPLAWHPHAKTAAVVGFGSGITTTTLLTSPNLERVDTIEIEPEMIAGAKLFGKIVEPAYKDPRSRIVIDDAKSYFARSRHKYDLVISEPSNPWVSGVASLFTVEWYRQVHRQLNDDGLLIQWVQIYEFSDELMATIVRALDEVFADYAVYAANDADLVIVASKRKLAPAPSASFTGWHALRPELQRLGMATVDDIESRRVGSRATIRHVLRTGQGVNSDYFPIVDHAAPKARFIGGAANLLPRMANSAVPVVEMLEGRSPMSVPLELSPPDATGSRRDRFAVAWSAIEFMQNGRTAPDSALPPDLAIFRAALWDCAALPAAVRMSEQIVQLAGHINPYVRPDDARRLWTAVRGAKCASRLGPDELKWLELVAAVGERAAVPMANLGADLLRRPDLSAPLRTYALTAAATGLLVQHKGREADALLKEALARAHARELQDPTMILLTGAAAEQLRKQ
jgi:predicted membrane-bound spermidine synthase